MCPSTLTLHMIHTPPTSESCTRIRAIPRIVLHPPPRKSIVPQYNALVLMAREAFMADGAALGGD